MNVLITGHDSFHNKGRQALIFTTTEILKRAFSDACFTVFFFGSRSMMALISTMIRSNAALSSIASRQVSSLPETAFGSS